MKFEARNERPDLARWKIAAIALMLLAGVAGVMIWVQGLPITRNVIGAPGMFPHRGPIHSLAEIATEHAAENLRGSQAILVDVEVAEVLDEQVFVIGDDGVRVPVVLLGELTHRQPDAAVELSPGDRVHVFGFVRIPGDRNVVPELEMLDPRTADVLRSHELYISALWIAPRSEIPRARTAEVPRVITSVSELHAAGDRDVLQARDVVLDRVRVVAVLGDHTFIVGSGRAQPSSASQCVA